MITRKKLLTKFMKLLREHEYNAFAAYPAEISAPILLDRQKMLIREMRRTLNKLQNKSSPA